MSDEEKKKNNDDTPETKLPPDPTITVNGQKLVYSAYAGLLPIYNAKEEHKANMFFTAYILDDAPAQRPLTFVFNGGPGSSSVWLHMGAIGPYRVKMHDEGWMPAPPYELEVNAHTWLDLTDLVFIDPIGTGYSRALDKDDNATYWSVDGDLKSVADFIQRYLTRYKRWTAPLFLAGESYGTTRAAGLSEILLEKGIALNGIALISTVLNLQTLLFRRGNDLPYNLYIPTYAATAWYHGKLDQDLLDKPLDELVAEVEEWSLSDYAIALMKGDSLASEEREAVLAKLVRYTGLDAQYIEGSKLRIHIWRFCKELLRNEHRTVGRLDSRFKGFEDLPITEMPEVDPSMTAIKPPYTSTFNHYMRTKLGYETEATYNIMNGDVGQDWEWEKGAFTDTSEALRKAMQRNPFMKIWVGQGYFDLATPHLAALYHFNHMGLEPEQHANLEFQFYEAGHMYYLHMPSLARMKLDIEAFWRQALAQDEN